MSETEKGENVKKEAAPKAARKKKEQEGTVVYVGPDIPGVAKRYAVFNNGLPEALGEFVKDNPIYQQLIVPVVRLPKVNAELEKENSVMSALYRRACEKLLRKE